MFYLIGIFCCFVIIALAIGTAMKHPDSDDLMVAVIAVTFLALFIICLGAFFALGIKVLTIAATSL